MVYSGVCSHIGCSITLIVNKRYMLCDTHNKMRLGTYDKPKNSINRSYKKKGLSAKDVNKIKLDEVFYEEIWNERPHYCEETGEFLGDELYDHNGKMINKWRFSHIIPKGRDSRFRRDKRNINLLTLKAHEHWEHRDQTIMKIYEKNQIIIKEMYASVVK